MIVVRQGYGVTPYVVVTIKRRTYLFRVDTGASRTAIATQFAAALGLRSQGPKLPFHPLGCTALVQPMRVSNWHLAGVALPPMLIIASKFIANDTAKVDGLTVAGALGSDVLARFGRVTFEFQQQRLILGAESVVGGHAMNFTLLHSSRGGDVELVHPEMKGRAVTLAVDTGAQITEVWGRLAQTLRLERLGQPVTETGVSGCTLSLRPVAIRRWTIGGVTLPSTFALSGGPALRGHGVEVQGVLAPDVLATFKQVTIEFAPRHLLVLGPSIFRAKPRTSR